MSDNAKADAKREPGWAEHTVVANLPRLLPGAHRPLAQVEEPRTLIGMPRPEPQQPPLDQPHSLAFGRPLAEVEEPRTVVGSAPSRALAESLIARYGGTPTEAERPPTDVLAPQHETWFRRIARFAREDFERAPRIVRLLLPALPLVAAATTFLDVDPAAPSLSRALAVAATARPAAAPPKPAQPALTLPTSNVTITRHPGRTLAAEAADAAARGDRTQAIAIYTQLAREHPEDKVYASAARILMAKD